MLKVVAPVLAVLAAFAMSPTPAVAEPNDITGCRRVYVKLDPIGQPGFSTCPPS